MGVVESGDVLGERTEDEWDMVGGVDGETFCSSLRGVPFGGFLSRCGDLCESWVSRSRRAQGQAAPRGAGPGQPASRGQAQSGTVA